MRMTSGYMAVLFFLTVNVLAAQKVLYSPAINDRFTDRFEIIGKAGDYYWIQKNTKKDIIELPAMPWTSDRQPDFEIYDGRLNQVNEVAAPVITSKTIKEYFVCSDQYFDQLIVSDDNNKTLIAVQRYTPEGNLVYENKIIDSLPFNENGNNFLLLRSENKRKILLLCFESIPAAPPRLHSFLFDANWQLIASNKYEHRYISQPVVQYDFFNYPVEHFSNSAVRLTDSGEWMMVAPSGRNQNFSLFHFNGTDTAFSYKEIKLPASSSVEDIALSADNEKQEASTAILSRFRYSTLKNVQVVKYSLAERKMLFDSSYRFNTLVSDRIKKENLYEESFVAVPKAGFMLLKEYGKKYPGTTGEQDADNTSSAREIMFTHNIAANDNEPTVKRDEYTKYNTLAGPRSNYTRGDLSLFYFPVSSNDSCWSGIINKEQTTELNSSYLSYAIVPAADRLVFLYNSFLRSENQYGTSTILDYHGEEIADDGIIFYQIKNTLQFQKARQIAQNEIAVPYQNYRRNGFAVIRF